MMDILIVVLKLFSDPPTLVYATPNSIVVEEGNTITTTCTATGNPQPTFQWFKISDLVAQLLTMLYLPSAMHRKVTKDHMHAELAIYLAHIMPLLLQMCNVSE